LSDRKPSRLATFRNFRAIHVATRELSHPGQVHLYVTFLWTDLTFKIVVILKGSLYVLSHSLFDSLGKFSLSLDYKPKPDYLNDKENFPSESNKVAL
jgi:hypothetical protein